MSVADHGRKPDRARCRAQTKAEPRARRGRSHSPAATRAHPRRRSSKRAPTGAHRGPEPATADRAGALPRIGSRSSAESSEPGQGTAEPNWPNSLSGHATQPGIGSPNRPGHRPGGGTSPDRGLVGLPGYGEGSSLKNPCSTTPGRGARTPSSHPAHPPQRRVGGEDHPKLRTHHAHTATAEFLAAAGAADARRPAALLRRPLQRALTDYVRVAHGCHIRRPRTGLGIGPPPNLGGESPTRTPVRAVMRRCATASPQQPEGG